MKTLKPNLEIQSVRAIVAGAGEIGQRFGELVSTEELVANIQPLYPKSSRPIPESWVQEYLGIRSVAVTTSTLNLCRQLWTATPRHTVESAYGPCQSYFNYTIYEMLDEAVQRVCRDLSAQQPHATIVAHIHICSGSHQFIESELYRIRKKTEIVQPTVCTLIVQQGCAGLLVALEIANLLLGPVAEREHRVLITAENNMILTAHLRARHTAPNNQDYNYWLWPAIFGEGVGAMVVGRRTQSRDAEGEAYWHVESVCVESMPNDPPVVAPVPGKDGIGFNVLLRAKQVRQNYLAGVGKHASLAIEASGGIDRLHRMCLHESNPLLVREIAMRLGIPLERVPSHSAEVGTLACVSAFTLLEEALAIDEPYSDRDYRVACSLIGEAGGHLLAGHLCLSRKSGHS